MAQIKRSYIDSHWLVFIFQGAIALFFGSITLFTSSESSKCLFPLVGICILAFSIIEFANSLYRSRRREGWIVSLLVALFDAAFGIALLFVAQQDMVWRLSLIAGYTFIRGVFQILIGFRATVDPTDRFIWVLCGIAGAIFGMVIFNSGHLQNIDFLRFFGAYMLIFGISCLIYGVHNHEQKIEDHEARSLAAKASRQKLTKSQGKKASKK